MYVGIAYIKLKIYDAFSLKDRRQIVTSVTNKIKNKFNVSVSILDGGEIWNLAEIGIAGVSSSKQVLESTYRQIDDLLAQDGRFEIMTYEIDIQKEI